MGINAKGVFEEVGNAISCGVGVRPGNCTVGKLRRAEDGSLPITEGDCLKGAGREAEAHDSQDQESLGNAAHKECLSGGFMVIRLLDGIGYAE